MKGVKADAQGQGDPQDCIQPYRGYSQPDGQGVVVLQSEIEVLEKPQNGQTGADGNEEPDFFLPQPGAARFRNPRRRRRDAKPLSGYLQTADIVDHRGGQQQDDKQGIRPAVENVTQKRQSQMPAPAGQPIVNGKRQGQKIEEENLRTEYHV
jgi:hypothetical protein